MDKTRTHKDLNAWKKACQFCLKIYEVTGAFPEDEKHGLTAQLRRTAVSIPSNIAEGYGRHSRRDYIRSLQIAYGSCCELETQLLIAGELGYMTGQTRSGLEEAFGEVERTLSYLIRSLKKQGQGGL